MDGFFTAKFDAYRNPGGGKPPPGLDFSRVKTMWNQVTPCPVAGNRFTS